jgi:serine protease Do
MSRISRIILTLSIIFIVTGFIFYIYESNKNNLGIVNVSDDLAATSYQNKDSANSNINDQRRTIITETVKKTSPAVVGITVTEIQQYVNPYDLFMNDPLFRQFFGNGGTFSQKVKALGSGFIISQDGYIVTNDHVAGDATEITVTLTNGKNYKAKLVGTDHATDIALVKIDGSNLPFVELGNSDDVIIGEWVIALGNPFGLFEVNDKPTVTVGVISSSGMNLDPVDNRYYLNMIQTDAAINGGNSGGPLVNAVGKVIGMNTLIFNSGNSNGNIGIGFAIPINKVKRIIEELKKNGKIYRNFSVGLRIQSIDSDIAKAYNLNSTRGVIVNQVYPGTSAAAAGIKAGDIILKVNDYNINDENTMMGVFQEFRTGQTIDLTIVRNGKEITKKMTLEKK